MEIKAKFIGTKQWSALRTKWVDIERGKENLYISLGFLHIFEKKKPKLIKNVENTESNSIKFDSDSDRTDNSESSILPI
jgi:hypothetical protein